MTDLKNVEYLLINTQDNTMHISLAGDEKAIIRTLKYVLSYSYQNQLTVNERINNEGLIINSVKVIKRLFGDKATLLDYIKFLHNSGGIGRKQAVEFSRIQGLRQWRIS